eukprot:gnl/Spiro4/10465_TR5604_c0_g1_i1.p1 gnl/Spiro4/10465_TR5604_c0_g1~~gnl/Spiro4/10465_TR5604_c0_g1_i1.p1  ORF type:complete len:898 (+),score=338.15 gnl/Spiro4/10465_TR5604_c0_g1_i1:66-2759(+)
MTDQGSKVVASLQAKTKTKLNYVCLVKSHEEDNRERRRYFCIARDRFFLVDDTEDLITGTSESFIQPEVHMFSTLVNFIFMGVASQEFQIVVKPEKEAERPIPLECAVLKELSTELQVYWKCWYACSEMRPPVFPQYGLQTKTNEAVVEDPYQTPPVGFEKKKQGEYFFFTPENCEKDPDQDGMYTRSDGLYITVLIEQLESVSTLTIRERIELQLLAERTAHDAGRIYEDDYYLQSSARYLKKMNLSGDLACWSAWKVVVQTVSREGTIGRDIVVIVLRRKYIPSFGESYQDIVVVVYGSEVDRKAIPGADAQLQQHFVTEPDANPEENNVAAIAEWVADSMSPENRVFQFDETLVLRKARMLQYNEDAMLWFKNHYRFVPAQQELAMVFYKSIITLLIKAGQPVNTDALPTCRVVDDPFTIVSELNQQGLDAGLTANTDPLLQEEWDRKVSRYLAFCCDGGLYSNQIGVMEIVEAEKHVDTSKPERIHTKQRLRKILDYFIHLCPVRELYKNTPISQKVEEVKTSKIYFNERVTCKLLKLMYIQNCCDRDGPHVYLELLCNMLLQTASVAALCVICDELARLCEDPDKRALVQAKDDVSSHMVTLLQEHEDEDDLILRVGRALANLTVGAPFRLKKNMLSEGLVGHVMPHLRKKDRNLTHTLLVVLTHCTSTATAGEINPRRQLVEVMSREMALIPQLVKLLRISLLEDPVKDEQVYIMVVVLLWNLSATMANRHVIADSGGVTALVNLMSKLRSEAVLEKIAGCLMILSASNNATKMQVGKLGGTELLTVLLSKCAAKPGIMRNVVTALYVLSSNIGNIQAMKAHGILVALERPQFTLSVTEKMLAEESTAQEHGEDEHKTHEMAELVSLLIDRMSEKIVMEGAKAGSKPKSRH